MKRIFVDLEICYKCKKCTAQCSYFYHQSENIMKVPIINNGIERFLAKAAQYYVCRRCEDPFCIASCPREALEKDKDGILHRHLFKCTSCKSCSMGCPFGVIYPEILDYGSSMCDYCFDRLDGDKSPLCTRTCPSNAIQYVEIEESKEKNIYAVQEKFLVHTYPWTIWKR